MRDRILANNYKVAVGPALCETALNGVSAWPASGSFIDVSGYELVHIVMHLGTLNASDAPCFTPACSDSASGTQDEIDSTLRFTPDVTTDDGYCATWTIEVAKLPDDHHFVLIKLYSGVVTNGSYMDAIFLLEGRHLPVTQTTTLLPSAHQFSWVG